MGDIIVCKPVDPAQAKFYTFRQNNSGGSFVYDEQRGIGEDVVVQALSISDANFRAERVGLYFDGDGDCSCCGDRWSPLWGSYDEGTDVPTHYGDPLVDYGQSSFSGYKYSAFIHYLDGTIEGIRSSNFRADDSDVIDTFEMDELD